LTICARKKGRKDTVRFPTSAKEKVAAREGKKGKKKKRPSKDTRGYSKFGRLLKRKGKDSQGKKRGKKGDKKAPGLPSAQGRKKKKRGKKTLSEKRGNAGPSSGKPARGKKRRKWRKAGYRMREKEGEKTEGKRVRKGGEGTRKYFSNQRNFNFSGARRKKGKEKRRDEEAKGKKATLISEPGKEDGHSL